MTEESSISLTLSEALRREEEAAVEAEREQQRREKFQSYLVFIDKIVSEVLIKAACSRLLKYYYFIKIV